LTRYLEPTWDMWWHFHRESFLDLKRRLAEGGARSRSDLETIEQTGWLPRVREALCAALDQRETPELNLGAMLAAARCSDAGEFPELLRYGPRIRALLSSPRSELAEFAALCLGVLGSPAELPNLESVLRDEEAGRRLVGARSVPQRQRCMAAYGLGLYGARHADTRQRQIIVRALTDMLQREDGRSLDLDAACVQALSIVPLPAERSESRSAAWISRQTQIRFLIEFVRRPAVPPLIEAHTLVALGQLAQGADRNLAELAVERSLQRLRDPASPAPVRAAAAHALGRVGEADSDEFDARLGVELLRSAEARELSERSYALMGLAEIALRTGSGETPRAREDLYRRELLDALENSRARVVAWAALALGVLEHGNLQSGAGAHEPTREALRKRFEKAASPEERSALAVAMGLASDPAAGALLLAALEKESEDTLRGYLALGLGLCRHAPAAGTLRELALGARNKPFLLEQSSIALALLGERGLAPMLIEQLKDSRSLAAQAWLSRTIGMISEQESVPALLDMVRNDKLGQDPRAQAAMALGRILDASALPWIQPYASALDYRNPTAVLIAGDGSGLLEMQ